MLKMYENIKQTPSTSEMFIDTLIKMAVIFPEWMNVSAGKSFLIIHSHGRFKNLHLNMASKTYHMNISVTKKVNDFTNLCISKNILQKWKYLSDI